jgi:hypothetical protein
MKTFLVLFLLFCCFLPGVSYSNYNTQVSSFIHKYENNEYRYEKVLIEGIWWVYVYDADGKLVDIYPDYEN